MLLGENDCVVCGEKFKTKEEHDKHYKKCADENIKTDYTDEEVFDKIYNEDNF
jgi:hypothetical protein